MPTDRVRWAERQIEALIEMGDDPQDAEKFVAAVLARVPEGEDPDTYLPSPMLGTRDATVTDEDVTDARADWYASDDVPARFKRLLDAKEEAG